MGVAQLKRIDQLLGRKREIARKYAGLLGQAEGIVRAPEAMHVRPHELS